MVFGKPVSGLQPIPLWKHLKTETRKQIKKRLKNEVRIFCALMICLLCHVLIKAASKCKTEAVLVKLSAPPPEGKTEDVSAKVSAPPFTEEKGSEIEVRTFCVVIISSLCHIITEG